MFARECFYLHQPCWRLFYLKSRHKNYVHHNAWTFEQHLNDVHSLFDDFFASCRQYFLLFAKKIKQKLNINSKDITKYQIRVKSLNTIRHFLWITWKLKLLTKNLFWKTRQLKNAMYCFSHRFVSQSNNSSFTRSSFLHHFLFFQWSFFLFVWTLASKRYTIAFFCLLNKIAKVKWHFHKSKSLHRQR